MSDEKINSAEKRVLFHLIGGIFITSGFGTYASGSTAVGMTIFFGMVTFVYVIARATSDILIAVKKISEKKADE